MKRVKFAIEDAMNQTAASIYGSEFCPNHPTYKVVSWCSNHEISICMVCSKLEHAKCQGIHTLEEVIKNTNSKSELKSLKHRVEETINIFKRLVKDRNQNIETLEDQKEVLRADVQTFKERIYHHRLFYIQRFDPVISPSVYPKLSQFL
jgi:tRNA1(Val) A37 N6-methylase TrmN6